MHTHPQPVPPSAYPILAAPLHGQAVRLVPLAQSHAERLHIAFQEQDLWTWQGRQPESWGETLAWVEEALSAAADRQHAPFVIETASGELAGTTRYMDLRFPDSGVEIGWTMVFEPFRRTCVNTESKFLLLQRAFEEVGCARVQLKTDSRNARSRAAIERIGGVFEGIWRLHKRIADGSLRDSAFFSITFEEWPQVKERLRVLLGFTKNGLMG